MSTCFNWFTDILIGCCFQVHAGPLAYAEAFLESPKVAKYKTDKVDALKDVFRSVMLLVDISEA